LVINTFYRFLVECFTNKTQLTEVTEEEIKAIIKEGTEGGEFRK
jgi:hypothetical protein